VSAALVALMPDVADAAIQLLDDAGQTKLVLMARETEALKAFCASLQVTNDVESVQATEALSRAVSAQKELEALRSKHCDPLRRQWEDGRAIFKRPLEVLEAIAGKGGTLERGIIAYRTKKRAEEQAALRAAELARQQAEQAEIAAQMALEEAKTAVERKAATVAISSALVAQQQAVVEAPRPTKGVQSASGSATDKVRWVVVGIHDLDAVPECYRRDDAVLEALTRVLQRSVDAGLRNINGVTIEEQVGLRRNLRR